MKAAFSLLRNPHVLFVCVSCIKESKREINKHAVMLKIIPVRRGLKERAFLLGA